MQVRCRCGTSEVPRYDGIRDVLGGSPRDVMTPAPAGSAARRSAAGSGREESGKRTSCARGQGLARVVDASGETARGGCGPAFEAPLGVARAPGPREHCSSLDSGRGRWHPSGAAPARGARSRPPRNREGTCSAADALSATNDRKPGPGRRKPMSPGRSRGCMRGSPNSPSAKTRSRGSSSGSSPRPAWPSARSPRRARPGRSATSTAGSSPRPSPASTAASSASRRWSRSAPPPSSGAERSA